ncbi:MAG: hypothetical protein Q4B82_07330 [Alysiella sp.]|uniref:hypothetical protein n=1 Tax=Alysiella sp. TaxID=1872483 RepID=UPI0026DB3233|nr:hypothetical protein [Alysiella sp.]MDO4434373.1 hypothetical protein [Alysiella sp.]
MFKPHIPHKYPVQVYRASDVGAPQLKAEAASLKTLLKTCLINGYGEGVNRKEPLGWKMFEETTNTVVFHCDAIENVGLKVENGEQKYATIHMVGGRRFEQYLGYTKQEENYFAYAKRYAQPNETQNWVLVGCEAGFILILPENTKQSKILYFGKINGLFDDTGNIVCCNTSWFGYQWFETGYLNGMRGRKYPLMVRSQWREGGTAPLSVSECFVLSPFENTTVPYPDALYQNTTTSTLILAEKTGAVRGTLPALYSCYHDLQNVITELDFVPMSDGQKWLKLNISDVGEAEHCFVLNIEEWEI